MTTTPTPASAIDPGAFLRGVPVRKLDWRRARRGLRALIADPERTDQVFEITRALSGRADVRNFARLLREPEGRRLVTERPDLLAALADRAALAGLPADSLGRLDVVNHNVPIQCGGVLVYPGDLMLADHDGVVCVPAAAAEETLLKAEEKVSGENLVRKALADGMTTTEAFAKFGIL